MAPGRAPCCSPERTAEEMSAWSLWTGVSCFPWAHPKMADGEAPPPWAVWSWGCLLCPQGP